MDLTWIMCFEDLVSAIKEKKAQDKLAERRKQRVLRWREEDKVVDIPVGGSSQDPEFHDSEWYINMKNFCVAWEKNCFVH